jgi:hypothetical protein
MEACTAGTDARPDVIVALDVDAKWDGATLVYMAVMDWKRGGRETKLLTGAELEALIATRVDPAAVPVRADCVFP